MSQKQEPDPGFVMQVVVVGVNHEDSIAGGSLTTTEFENDPNKAEQWWNEMKEFFRNNHHNYPHIKRLAVLILDTPDPDMKPGNFNHILTTINGAGAPVSGDPQDTKK